MQQGRNPTREQKKVLSRNGLDAREYFVVKAVGRGWLFRHRQNTDTQVVCYSDKSGLFERDGITPVNIT